MYQEPDTFVRITNEVCTLRGCSYYERVFAVWGGCGASWSEEWRDTAGNGFEGEPSAIIGVTRGPGSVIPGNLGSAVVKALEKAMAVPAVVHGTFVAGTVAHQLAVED